MPVIARIGVFSRRRLRRLIASSWVLSRPYYRLRGARLVGRPSDEVWYFAYGANIPSDPNGIELRVPDFVDTYLSFRRDREPSRGSKARIGRPGTF
ncbi:MAG: hypothetical protein JO007_16935 [Alphaproteobacteria bacterium]|nr:hypothetical protein [Alphaproteobacteria bacterium]